MFRPIFAVSIVCLWSANAMAAEPKVLDARCPPPTNYEERTDWSHGELSHRARACNIAMLRIGLTSDGTKLSEVAARAEELRWYYQARAGRQQRWLDANTWVAAGGAVGLLGTASAPAASQTIAGAVTVAPLVITQFNTYEPTRDLFFGAAVGTKLIAERYDRFDLARRRLSGLVDSNRSRTDAACAQVKDQRRVVEAWPKDSADTVTILPEFVKVEAACKALVDDRRYHQAMVAFGKAYEADLSRLYARDLIAFDEVIVHRDRDLRYTPYETVSAILATPFQAASTLLGSDGRKAIDVLKSQTSFEKLSISLSQIPLPPERTYTVRELELSPDALKRRDVARGATATDMQKSVAATLDILSSGAEAINQSRYELSLMGEWTRAMREAAAATQLTFDYDAAKAGLVNVSVGPPVKAEAPLVQAGGKS